MSKYKEYAVVCSQEQIAADIYSLWIQTEEIARAAGPGQFLSVYTGDGTKLLPRPISICEIDREQGRLRLVYRVTGPGTGTEQFSRLKQGDQVEVMGPLGNGFPKDLTGTPFLVGGGIGIPPMLELAKELPGDKKIILGFRDEQYLTEELNAYGEVYVATEDGSAGTKGKCTGRHPGERTSGRCDLRLRAHAYAAGVKGVFYSGKYSLLSFPGRADGLRDRSLPWLRLPVNGGGRPQQCAQ